MASSLPSFAPFPSASWRDLIAIEEWTACLAAWVTLAESHLLLSNADFSRHSLKDESLVDFVATFMSEVGSSGQAILGGSVSANEIHRAVFLLASRCLRSPSPPSSFLQWEFLANLGHVYGKKRTTSLLSALSKPSHDTLEKSLAGLKKFLIKNLDDGLHGDLKGVEERLSAVIFLIHASPATAELFLAGSDFLDGLLTCYRVMNPPLRKAIVTTAYLCLLGLTEGASSKYSMLTDQLYSLKAAADAHKAGPINANDSLVPELVTTTPVLQQIEFRAEAAGSLTSRMKTVLRELGTYRRQGSSLKPKRPIKRKIDKGKSIAMEFHQPMDQELHVHRMSSISQIQDLFPELGSGFVAKVLDIYDDDTEQTIAHILEGTLPSHLQDADRSEELSSSASAPPAPHPVDIAPHSTPPQLPTRRNIFDDDELDNLTVETSKLHFGKQNPEKTADDVLADRSTAPNKAAILSALAAFDSDDDERDDTYDAEDVGGAVEGSVAGEDVQEANEEVLFGAYQANPKIFDRDPATRKGNPRQLLKEETGMTDEAIEGWGIMLSRNPQQKRRLEIRLSLFSGVQTTLASTSWRASPAGSGAEDSGTDGGVPIRGGRGRGRGGMNRGRGENVAGPPGEKDTEQARRRKEATKGSRANHNRRDQRARKMGRGGFAG